MVFFSDFDYELSMDSISDDTLVGINLLARTNGSIALCPGINGNALLLDGVDDYAEVVNIENTCLGDIRLCTEGLSLAFWLYPNTKLVGVGHYVVGTLHGIHDLGFHVTWSVAETFRVRFQTDTNFWYYEVPGALPIGGGGKWDHYVIVWKNLSVLKVFKNGEFSGAALSSIVPSDGPLQNLTFGASPKYKDRFIGVRIDSFKAIDNELTDQQVKRIYIDETS